MPTAEVAWENRSWQKFLDKVGPFFFNACVGPYSTSPAVPVVGIPGITFFSVQVGVHPCCVFAGKVLHGFMRFVPVAFPIPP